MGEARVGSTLGGYRIEAQLGSGATGTVYRAKSEDGDEVALKVLDSIGTISGLERRFAREAKVLKKLSHPNIVEIVDFGVEDGETFIAMELLEGETLEQRLERESLPIDEVLPLYAPVLAALSEAHAHEVVHRDLKPANVFLVEGGEVKLLDFGLAKMLSVEDTPSDEETLTRRGRIVGTPAYMAPEQITDAFVDVRADVYALGVMLFELLADRRPFRYERRSELLRAHLLEPLPDITACRSGLWVHEALRALIEKALSKSPGDRFEDGTAMNEALLALPDESVRLEALVVPSPRDRREASSVVISDSERKAVTESAGISDEGRPPSVAPVAKKKNPPKAKRAGAPGDRDTDLLPRAPVPPSGLSTQAKVLLAAVIVAAVIALTLAAMGLPRP
ncbi:MAG: serine/threonine-protein kinase [Sandaracinaceae bacterium]